MVEEKVIAASAPEPSDGTVVAADSHKRKLKDLELNNNGPEPLTESEAIPDPEPLNDSVQGEDNGGADESETKQPHFDSNGGTVSEIDALEPEEEKPEQPESVDDNNGQSVEGQEPVKEPVETVTEEPISNENEKSETATAEEQGNAKVENEEASEERPRADTQMLSRKIEVPNDKVRVLIGKAGDTIRSLQDNSGATIRIIRDTEKDARAPRRPLELVGTLENINKAEKLIKDLIAEAASGGEQLEIQVPIGKVGIIIGKGGETIRNLQTRSKARIQLIQQNVSGGEQTKERIVRITGNKRQIETARQMIKDVMKPGFGDMGGSGGALKKRKTVQAASVCVQLEIQVPIEKVGIIIGKGGKTIRNLQTRSEAHIQLIQQNVSDGDQERTVRITGNKRQIETAREMIMDVMNPRFGDMGGYGGALEKRKTSGSMSSVGGMADEASHDESGSSYNVTNTITNNELSFEAFFVVHDYFLHNCSLLKLEKSRLISNYHKILPLHPWFLLCKTRHTAGSRVLNQKACKCCAIVSGCDSTSGVVKYQDKIDISFSIQDVVDSMPGHVVGSVGKGCAGGYTMLEVFEYGRQYGFIPRKYCPVFKAKAGKCKAYEKATRYFVQAYEWNYVGNICSILDKYPITANIKPTQSLHRFRPIGGALVRKPYRHPKAKTDRSDISHVNHRVLIEGYVEDENGKILFYLIRNSWGYPWGFRGYALVLSTCLFNFAFATHVKKVS